MNDDVAVRVQKNIMAFCHYIGKEYIERWRKALLDAKKPLQVLSNLTDQLQHVEKANLPTMPNFETIKNTVTLNILELIEEEFTKIKELMDNLNVANQELKNKFSVLERSSNSLDFTQHSFPVKGNSTQPSLPLLLADGYEFCNYFSNKYQEMKDNISLFNPTSDSTLEQLKNSFEIDFKSDLVVNYISLIAVVGCENFQKRDVSLSKG